MPRKEITLTCYWCQNQQTTKAQTQTTCNSCGKTFQVKKAKKIMARKVREKQYKAATEGQPESVSSENVPSGEQPPSKSGGSIWEMLGPSPNDADILQGISASLPPKPEPEMPGQTGYAETEGMEAAPGLSPLIDGNALMFEILNTALMVILTGKEADKAKLAELGGKALALMMNFTIAPSEAQPVELPAWVPLAAVFVIALVLPPLTKIINEKGAGMFGKLTDKIGGFFNKKKKTEDGDSDTEISDTGSGGVG